MEPPFDKALGLYAHNVPRYYALVYRSCMYARANNLRLHSCIAQDIPLHREDRDLSPDRLHDTRCKYVKSHDQATSNISSIVPLVNGLPLRLADTVNRALGLYRGRRVRIHNWKPHEEEEQLEVDGDFLFSKMHSIIYVVVPGATWIAHAELGVGVYPVEAVRRTWEVNKSTKVRVRRTGFFVVLDVALTGHMVQGTSLEALLADVVEKDSNDSPREDLQVIAYVMLARAIFLRYIWIVQSVWATVVFKEAAA